MPDDLTPDEVLREMGRGSYGVMQIDYAPFIVTDGDLVTRVDDLAHQLLEARKVIRDHLERINAATYPDDVCGEAHQTEPLFRACLPEHRDVPPGTSPVP